MRKHCTYMKINSIAMILLLIGCLSFSLTAHAESDTDSYEPEPIFWENPETGYQILLEDDAALLDSEERAQLAEEMQGITTYGNAVFLTTTYNSYSASSYARDFYSDLFGHDSGTLFLIDMDNREIYIFSDGAVYRTVTKSYAESITDNVYSYASKGNYYRCASEAFEQINTLLAGQKIAQPMKYISNVLLALILATLINYFLAMRTAGSAKASSKEILNSISTHFSFRNTQKWLTKQDKVYSPPSSGSSGGGHSGGGGGGHSSGGGGGHRF
ncbi:MAG: TPM domain-containing protein [Lachnospiraceae bacterium]|nr:TPM domain-containing protein [Lachnospiraceae bacterium]